VHLFDALPDFRKCNDSGISSWDWNLSGQHSTYHALFPRAWTVYDGMPSWSCGTLLASCDGTNTSLFYQEMDMLYAKPAYMLIT
jgi:hypothetical protein